MLTHEEQRNLYGNLTNNDSSSNLTLGDTLINSETKRVIAKMGDNLLEKEVTDTTIAEKQNYALPNDLKKLNSVTIQEGTTIWPLAESPSLTHWNNLNSTGTSYTSDIPVFYRIFNREVKVWPIPASSANVITYNYDKRFAENTILDYNVGTVGSATTGTVTIFGATAGGTSTVWTDSLEGRHIQIAKSNNQNSGGDGYWYEIKEVVDGTTIVLSTNYQGQNISTGTATYTIGEISPLPDGFHELPVYRAAEIYWGKNDEARAQLMRTNADRLENELLAANLASQKVVAEDADEGLDNPNLFIRDIG